jgi:hypothetical protein
VIIAMRTQATRIRTLTREAQTLAGDITDIVTDTAPFLLADPGVGAITATQRLSAGHTPAASQPKHPSRASPAPRRSPPQAA